MCFETYAEAAACAREGNKVVRFRSAEYVALRTQTESAYPLVIKAPRESITPCGKGETLLEFVDRSLSAYGLNQHAEHISDAKHASVDPASPIPIQIQGDGSSSPEFPNQSTMIETPTFFARLILSRLSESEIGNLGRMREDDIAALLKLLAIRFLTLRPKGRCH
jgi:hypothetical protein